MPARADTLYKLNRACVFRHWALFVRQIGQKLISSEYYTYYHDYLFIYVIINDNQPMNVPIPAYNNIAARTPVR